MARERHDPAPCPGESDGDLDTRDPGTDDGDFLSLELLIELESGIEDVIDRRRGATLAAFSLRSRAQDGQAGSLGAPRARMTCRASISGGFSASGAAITPTRTESSVIASEVARPRTWSASSPNRAITSSLWRSNTSSEGLE